MKRDDKILSTLKQLEMGQQKTHLLLVNHLNEHKLSFNRLTKVYIPTFGMIIPALSFLASWFHTNHHR